MIPVIHKIYLWSKKYRGENMSKKVMLNSIFIQCPSCETVFPFVDVLYYIDIYQKVNIYGYDDTDYKGNDLYDEGLPFDYKEEDPFFERYECPYCGYELGNDINDVVKNYYFTELPTNIRRKIFDPYRDIPDTSYCFTPDELRDKISEITGGDEHDTKKKT